MTGTALSLIAECRRLGIALRADGDRLRYKPVEKMPPDLAQRLTAHKPEVLAVLRTLDPGGSTAGCTDCPQPSAAEPDGPTRPDSSCAIRQPTSEPARAPGG